MERFGARAIHIPYINIFPMFHGEPHFRSNELSFPTIDKGRVIVSPEAISTPETPKPMQDGCFADAPKLVAMIMSNGFKSPCGVLTVAPRLEV